MLRIFLLLVLVSACFAEEFSFRNHVQPVLSKSGCNAGACHGAAAGQNGFRRSRRGYDDDGDFITLTRQSQGRRINLSDPGRSLLLLKATATLPHKGGKRFDVDSVEYKILADWIAAGTPGPRESDPRIERLEVSPAHIVLTNGATKQLTVRAHFNNGHSEDVTRWVKYTAANASVTQVSDEGLVNVVGHGEGAITAWYLSRIAVGTISVPFTNSIPKEVFAKAVRHNFIDDHILKKLQDLNVEPSPRSSDSEFIRRVYMDTIGVLPTADEARTFLADSNIDKRETLIDALLDRPEFADYWSYQWSDLLLVSSKKLRPSSMWSFYNWIHDNVSANTPWDEMVRRIITAQGSTEVNGAANFFAIHDNPADLSETASQAFMGMAINCAKCHNHPMEKWTNDQYYQMANLFARVRTKNGAGDGERIVFATASGDLVQPLRGKPQRPAPLDGDPLPADFSGDRREPLAEWLTSPDNPYFTRAIVNRIWANYFGVGLVENLDDLRMTNPASNEELLSAAAAHLVQNKYNLKSLMRAVLRSAAYQRTSDPLPTNKDENRFYSRYYPKRLMAEVLLDAYSQVTAAATQFKDYPKGMRAIQLPDSKVDSYFLGSFGRPEREKTCSCERTSEPSVSQVLHIFNGDTLNQKLAAKQNRIEKLIESKKPVPELVEEVFLASLARFPTSEERLKFEHALESAKPEELRAALEDTFWALLSSKEFIFNH